MSELQFVHPKTHAPLILNNNQYCSPAGEMFPIRNAVPVFISINTQQHMEEERSGLMNCFKSILRRYPRLYVWLIYIISPVCFTGYSAKEFLRKFATDATIISIGAGVHQYGRHVKNIDIFPYEGVDIVADAMELPLADNSVDSVICEYLLEHVPNPQKVVDEIIRVLRPGGEAYIAVPFVYPFHASPNDFHRWSKEGLKVLCKNSEIVKLGSRSGPTSALVAQFSTWLAIVLSCGSEALYSIFAALIPAILFPIKFLDLLLQFFGTTLHGTASWYIVIRK